MTLTQSQKIEQGIDALDFTLPDVISEKELSLEDVRGDKATVIMFICNHCPYVQHINTGVVELSKEYMHKGVGFVGISANDAEKYPEDGPEKMKETARELGYPFPYLYDASQEVAKSYRAKCTPDLFIFNAELSLAYHGQFDDSRLGNNIPVTGKSFRQALDCLIAGVAVSGEQVSSIGCSIKWK